MKHYSEKTAAAVMNALLRAARKTTREGLHDAWTDEQGRTCATDGFRAYCLNNAPRGLKVTWTIRPDPAREAERAAGNNRILNMAFKCLNDGNVVEMPAPDEDAVNEFIAYDKQNGGRGLYDMGNSFPLVNAKYLLDIIRLFPVAKWYVIADPYDRMISPVYVVAEEGCACLMPVKTNRKPFKAHNSAACECPKNIPEEPADTATGRAPEAPAAPASAEDDGKARRSPVPEKSFVGQAITGNGWKILFDGETQRTRVIFENNPTDAARAALDKAGFFFSSAMNSWNKKLTFKAHRAAQALAGELSALYA